MIYWFIVLSGSLEDSINHGQSYILYVALCMWDLAHDKQKVLGYMIEIP